MPKSHHTLGTFIMKNVEIVNYDEGKSLTFREKKNQFGNIIISN